MSNRAGQGGGASGRLRDGRGGAAADSRDDRGDSPDSGGSGQRSGQEVTPEARARDVVYQLLAVRARSRLEVQQHLKRKQVDDDLADSMVQKFVDAGLIDDAAFAEEWVHARQRHQGLGRKALGYELRHKGIDQQIVDEVLSSLGADEEEARARELVQRKLRSMNVSDDTAKRRRLVGMLARKGYAEGLAFRIVREEMELSDVDFPDPGESSL